MKIGAPADAGLALDHLVVAARTLDDGLAWCESTFELRPADGGRHAARGTHNRVLAIATAAYPRAYLEIIAIDPAAAAPERPRWFDLDDPALQRRIAAAPQLVHWVARCTDIDAACAALRAAGADGGPPRRAERATPAGVLRWTICVRDDGRRPLGGAVPALIAWDGPHPADALPASGVALERFEVGAWPAGLARPAGVGACDGGPALRAVFATPRGRVELRAANAAPIPGRTHADDA